MLRLGAWNAEQIVLCVEDDGVPAWRDLANLKGYISP